MQEQAAQTTGHDGVTTPDNSKVLDILSEFQSRYKERNQDDIPFADYIEQYRNGSLSDKSAAQRLLSALGKASPIEKTKEMKNLFGARNLAEYDAFKGFHGLEEPLEQIVRYIKEAAQGAQASKQMLVLVGPPSSGKSTLVSILKNMMETAPFYAISGSEYNDHPLAVFNTPAGRPLLEKLDIPLSRVEKYKPSQGLLDLLKSSEGDLTKLKVSTIYPSIDANKAIATVEAGEDMQDSFIAGLKQANGGLLDLSEVLKCSDKELGAMLKFLNATEGHEYQTENGPAPFNGMIVIQANCEEWQRFKEMPRFDSLMSRIREVEVPHNLRASAEVEIYKDYLAETELADAPVAPHSLELMAHFSVATRMLEMSADKVKAYDGRASIDEINNARDEARKENKELELAKQEGMFGLPTRKAFNIVAQAYNSDPINEANLDPIALIQTLESIANEQPSGKWHVILTDIQDEYATLLKADVERACVPLHESVKQEKFEQYLSYLDHLSANRDQNYRTESGETITPSELEDFIQEVYDHLDPNVDVKDLSDQTLNKYLHYNAEKRKFTLSEANEYLQDAINSLCQQIPRGNDKIPLRDIVSPEGAENAETRELHANYREKMKEAGYSSEQHLNNATTQYLKLVKN